MLVYLNGLMLGLSLITALGPQNIFLIRQGALRAHAVLSATVCFCCDVILVSASIAGLHHLLEMHPILQTLLTWLGVVFLFFYGFNALTRGLSKAAKHFMQGQKFNRLQIMMMALGFSLLNPHAIIDSLVIIGGGSSQYPDHPHAFLFGVLTANLLWFSSLTLTTYFFAPILTRVVIWRRIEVFSGLLMIFMSAKLAFTQFY